jgi:hypothetical protein
MKKRNIVKGPGPKVRRPVQKKPNTVMKSKKDYRRKAKHGKLWSAISEE